MQPRQQRATRPPTAAPAIIGVSSVLLVSPPGTVRISVTERVAAAGSCEVSIVVAAVVEARLVETWLVTADWAEESATAMETVMRTLAAVTVTVTALESTPVRDAATEAAIPSMTAVV